MNYRRPGRIPGCRAGSPGSIVSSSAELAVHVVGGSRVGRRPEDLLGWSRFHDVPGRSLGGQGRNSFIKSAIATVLAGVVSDGLSTIVLPAASAGAHFQTAIIIG
jgi:hypothetical protein